MGRRLQLRVSCNIKLATRGYATPRHLCRWSGNCRSCRSTGSDHLRPSATNRKVIQSTKERDVSEIIYVSRSRIERKEGPLRVAYLPGESQPVIYSVHGAIAEHYKVNPANLKETHSSTIDYVISATAG